MRSRDVCEAIRATTIHARAAIFRMTAIRQTSRAGVEELIDIEAETGRHPVQMFELNLARALQKFREGAGINAHFCGQILFLQMKRRQEMQDVEPELRQRFIGHSMELLISITAPLAMLSKIL